jgi:hypothetical protein
MLRQQRDRHPSVACDAAVDGNRRRGVTDEARTAHGMTGTGPGAA